MAVAVHCPKCKAPIALDGQSAGSVLVCAGCGQRLKVPAGRSSAASGSAVAPGAAAVETGRSAGATRDDRRSADQPTQAQQIGRFEIQERLGAGQFGTVYRAFDTVLKRDVALKVPQASLVDDDAAQKRFLREAEAAAQLRHPHIVPVYDAGREGDTFYIASAFIEGATLQKTVEGKRPDFRQAADWVRKLAGALAYAGGRGIVHRDVKPANIMLDHAGEPHLMDFGLARTAEAADKLTHDGSLMGTPAYMSPEQAGANVGPVSPASDQYSLGVVLYELLCGQRPFPEGNVLQVIYQIREKTPTSPRVINPAMPRDLETICQKAIARQPADRYTDCAALSEDLRRWLADEPIAARRLGLAERAVRWTRRNPAVAASLAVAMASLVGLAGGAVIWARHAEQSAAKIAESAAKVQESLIAVERALADSQAAQESQVREQQRADKATHDEEIASYSRTLAQVFDDLVRGERPGGLLDRLEHETPRELRGWEWHLLRGLCRDYWRPGIAARRELPNAQVARCSMDGRWLAIARSTASMEEIKFPTGRPGATPDEFRREMEEYERQREAAMLSHQAALATQPCIVEVVDLLSGDQVFQTTVKGVPGLQVDPGGTRLTALRSSVSEPTHDAAMTVDVSVWEIKTRRQTVDLHVPDARGAAVSPDGDWLAVPIKKQGLSLRSTSNGEERALLPWTEPFLVDVAFSDKSDAVLARGRILGGAKVRGALRAWSVPSGQEIVSYTCDSGTIAAASMSPDGDKLALAVEEEGRTSVGHVEVRDVANPSGGAPVILGDNSRLGFGAFVRWSADANCLLARSGHQGCVGWNPATRSSLFQIDPAHENSLFDAVLVPESVTPRLRTVGYSQSGLEVVDWQPERDAPATRLLAASQNIESLHLNRDGTRVVCADRRGVVSLWNAVIGQKAWSTDLRNSNDTSNGVFFCRGDSAVLVLGLTRNLRMFDAASGEQVGNRPTPRGSEFRPCRAVTSDGRYLLEGGQSVIDVCDLTDDKFPTWSLTAGLSGNVGCLGCSAENPALICANAGDKFLIIDLSARKVIAEGSRNGVLCDEMVLCDQGRTVVASAQFDVRRWESASNSDSGVVKREVNLRPPKSTPDGLREVGWSINGGLSLQLTDVESGRVMFALQPPTGTGMWTALDISRDGTTIVGGTDRGEIVVWRTTFSSDDGSTSP